MNYSNQFLAILSLMTLASCGASGGDGGSSSGQNPRQEMQISEGTYKAILRPYNFNLGGWIPSGVTDIKISGNEMEVKSWLDDSANVTHMQNVHLGTQCPSIENDSNRDGFVDFNESQNVAGRVFFPLDADLNSPTENAFPKGDFTYYQKAPVENLVSGLQLPSAEALALEGRVIIVMGVAANRGLPETVSMVNGATREQSIPIACGVIERKN